MALGGLTLIGGGSRAHDAVPGAAPLLGVAKRTLGAIAFASLSALARMLARRIHPLQAVSFGFVVGAVLLAPIAVLSGPAEPPVSLGVARTLQLTLVLIYLGAVPTALAYICYFYGMQLSRTATAGIAATLVEPAVAVLLAAGLLEEQLSPAAWLGVACLPFATIVLGLEGSRSIREQRSEIDNSIRMTSKKSRGNLVHYFSMFGAGHLALRLRSIRLIRLVEPDDYRIKSWSRGPGVFQHDPERSGLSQSASGSRRRPGRRRHEVDTDCRRDAGRNVRCPAAVVRPGTPCVRQRR